MPSPQKRRPSVSLADTQGSPFDRRRTGEEKRLAIIRAAGQAFRQRGFHHTSLDDVAKALGVTKPTLYYYAKGKQDLLFQCHQHALDLGDAATRRVDDEAPALRNLERVLAFYIEQITVDFHSYTTLSDLNDLDEPQRKEILRRRRKFDRFCRDLIRRGHEDGSIRPCDPMLTVFWIMGAINAIPRWFDPSGSLSGQEVARQYTALLTEAIAHR
jgi:TetR/AcrR family transcriptional regulator